MGKIVAIIVGITLLIVFIGGFLFRSDIEGFLGKSNPTPQPAQAEAQPAPSEDFSKSVQVQTDPKKGDYLADEQGHALYTYDKDAKDKSSCKEDCEKTWKPYTSEAKKTKPIDNVNVKPVDVKVKPVDIKVKPVDIKVTPAPIHVKPVHIKPEHVTKIKRADNTHQYAYKGHALYHYSGDKKPSDVTGDNVDKSWHLAKP